MTDDLHFSTHGAVGVITLTRPRALNALTRDMAIAIDEQLAAWADEAAIKAVLIEGEGDRAFCAGGDIRWLHDTGKTDPEEAASFFRAEYRMNTRLHTYKKPIIALIDGVCMGGGVGLSLSAPFRVATERTIWALPECGIGLIPDVGATWLLPRLRGGLGPWLALTGSRLSGPDVLTAGVATHYVASDRLDVLRTDLLSLSSEDISEESIAEVISAHHAAEPSQLDESLPAIDHFFQSVESVPALLDELAQNGSPFAQDAITAIGRGSPTSLALTVEALRRATDDFAECISREFCVTANILRGHDFYEGVRAQIIDKDRQPKWSPTTAAGITPEAIDAAFSPPKDGALDLNGIA